MGGQKNPVLVYRFCAAKSVEEKMIEKASNKRRLEHLVVSNGKFVEAGAKSYPEPEPVASSYPEPDSAAGELVGLALWVGVGVGVGVPVAVGWAVGERVELSSSVGECDGDTVGVTVVSSVDDCDVDSVGSIVGVTLGTSVGDCDDGDSVGSLSFRPTSISSDSDSGTTRSSRPRSRYSLTRRSCVSDLSADTKDNNLLVGIGEMS